MAETLWRDCAEWLVQCQVLPPNHRVTWPNAQLLDLARTLQDGTVLCQLLHILKPGCIDLKEASLSPKMSSFACTKNARLFVDTCRLQFGMKSTQLFEPEKLQELENFIDVLKCLSELSKMPPVRARGFPMFPRSPPVNQVEYCNIEAFKNLEDFATADDMDGGSADSSLQTTKEEEHIYEDLCYTKVPRTTDELPEPKDKRGHCLKEMLETERNYVKALELIISNFMKPVKEVMDAEDVLTIFINIEDLFDCHQKFVKDLEEACFSRTHVGQLMKDCFGRWRLKLAMYGRYCSSLTKAQQKLDQLMESNATVANVVKKCQNENNMGRFRLRELLSVPMQRVLKYHLLLRELSKHLTFGSTQIDRAQLQQALDMMVDLSFYINEVKRDTEMIDLIKSVEQSIVDIEMPDRMHITIWGRLLIDGQVRFRPHEAIAPKTRHIFVFDRVLLIVKPIKGDQYVYKEALSLSEFKLDEQVPAKSIRDKWNHQWHIYNADKQLGYTMAVKTEELRKKWIEAIKLALSNLNPQASEPVRTHPPLEYCTFDEATLCTVCNNLLRGAFFQGYKCGLCDATVHKECVKALPDCQVRRPGPMVPARSLSAHFRHSSGSMLLNGSGAGPNSPGLPPQRSPRTQSMSGLPSLNRAASLDSTAPLSPRPVPPPPRPEPLVVHREHPEPDSAQENNLNRLSMASTVSVPSPLPLSPGGGEHNWQNLQSPGPFSPAGVGSQFAFSPEDEELLVYPWFAGFMDREKAEEMLGRFQNGTFLLRISSKGETYKAISVKFEGKVRHIRILRPADSESIYLAPNRYFVSVPELIAFYEQNSLEQSFAGMTTTLRMPYKRALLPQLQDQNAGRAARFPRVRARYSFAATTGNMLTIAEGDILEIISKTGEERGWWKGKLNDRVGYFPLSYVEEVPDGEAA